MTDMILKEKIAKLYSLATKAGIVLASAVIIISLVTSHVYKTDIEIDRYVAMAAVFMFTATPFIGILIALFYYLSKKNRPMVLFSAGIILALVISILFKLQV